MYWTQDSKWYGLFDIEWIFIKDTPFKAFKNIDIMMKDGQIKPVTYSRDTQEIPFNEGKKMAEIIEKYLNSNTILEHFEYYDMRQENYEKTLQMGGNLPQGQGGSQNTQHYGQRKYQDKQNLQNFQEYKEHDVVKEQQK